MSKENGTVLLAEDDDEDFHLVERAFKKLDLSKKIVRARDGQELIDYLHGHPHPELILLDLNMPIKGGREVLREIKADDRLRDIPVVVLTTSKLEGDVDRAYELGVNSFIRKPSGQEEFVEMVRIVCRYWFEIVELPRQGETPRYD